MEAKCANHKVHTAFSLEIGDGLINECIRETVHKSYIVIK